MPGWLPTLAWAEVDGQNQHDNNLVRWFGQLWTQTLPATLSTAPGSTVVD
jgi:hypothetical protein